MLTKERQVAGHTERMTIVPAKSGWEVRQERDGRVVKLVTYLDWHRVERALMLFELALPNPTAR